MSDNERYNFDRSVEDVQASGAAQAKSSEFAGLGAGRKNNGSTPIFHRGTNSGIIKEFKEGLDIVIQNSNLEKSYNALSIEGSKLANKRPIDMVVLTYSDTFQGHEYLFIAPVLFEMRNGHTIPDKIENLGNGIQNVIHQYTEDMIGPGLSRDLATYVKGLLGKDSSRAYVTATIIFPANITFSKDDEQAREDWATALSIKVREARVRVDQESPVDEVRKDILDKQITATYFNTECVGVNAVVDREGNPVRSDFRAVINAPTAMFWTETDQQSSVQPAVTVHCFPDLIYEGEADEQMIARGIARNRTQIYTPLITMTRVEDSVNGDTTMCHLAAGIAAVLSSHNSTRPYQHWMPSIINKGKINKTHDYGALGYDVSRLDPNLDPKKLKDAKFDTSSNRLSEISAFQYLSGVTRPNIVLAYDARQIGDNSHIDMVLLEAAEYQGEVGSGQQACETIVRYFDAATKGCFSTLLNDYRTKNPNAGSLRDIIFANAGADRVINIPYGFYIDTENNRRDIREFVSMMPYLNHFGATSDELLDKATDAWHRRGLSRGERQQKQLELLDLVLNVGQYKIRGTHYRLLFGSMFLNLYAQALAQSATRISVNDGLLPNVNNARVDTGAIYSQATFAGYGGVITNNLYGAGATRQGALYTLPGVGGVGFM